MEKNSKRLVLKIHSKKKIIKVFIAFHRRLIVFSVSFFLSFTTTINHIFTNKLWLQWVVPEVVRIYSFDFARLPCRVIA